MNIEEAIRKADFSKYAAAHKEALRAALFGNARKHARERPPVVELTLDDLEGVTAASNAWIERDDKFPHT